MVARPSVTHLDTARDVAASKLPFFGAFLDFMGQLVGGDPETELTLLSGAIPAPTRHSHSVDTESDAATDDLTNAPTTELVEGSHLKLRLADPARIVTIKHNAGGAGAFQFADGKDFVFQNGTQQIVFEHIATGDWREVDRQHGPNLAADPSLAPYLAHNVIINGGMNVDQLGGSPFTPANNDYLLDEYQAHFTLDGGALANQTFEQVPFALGQADVPGAQFYAKINASSTGGGTLTDCGFSNKVKDVATLAGKKARLSYKAKADGAREFALDLEQFFGGGGSPSAPVRIPGTLRNLTTSWQKFSETLDIDSISGKTLGTDGTESLKALLLTHSGSATAGTVVAASANDVWITEIQLEQGESESDFQRRTFAEELALVHESYYLITHDSAVLHSHGFGYSQDANNLRITVPTGVTMRANPSIDTSGVERFEGAGDLRIADTYSNVEAFAGHVGFSVLLTVSTTPVEAFIMRLGGVSDRFGFDARL